MTATATSTTFHPPRIAFTYAYDQLNRRITRQLRLHWRRDTTTYDAHDRPLTVTDQIGNTTSYVYDGFGDVIQQTSPDTGTDGVSLRLRQQPDQKADALSVTTNHTYDALDRVLDHQLSRRYGRERRLYV